MLPRYALDMKKKGEGLGHAARAVLTVLLAFIMTMSPLAPATPAVAMSLSDLFGLFDARSSNELAGRDVRDLEIAVVSDTHYYPLNYVSDCQDYQTYVGGDPKMLEESGSILDAAFAKVKADKPDVMLISGDLAKDGEVQGLQDIANKLAEIETAGTQVYVINGNHDIYNSDACSFASGKKERVESASPAKFREIFAKHGYDGKEGQTYYKDSDEAREARKEYGEGELNRDADTPGGLSYSVDLGNYLVLAIDSGQYLPEAGTGLDTKEHITAGRIDKHVLDWATRQVKEADRAGKTVVGLMHHGLIPHFKGEDNILSEYVVDNWRFAATELADAGMRYIFTGHMHANDVAEFTTPAGNHIVDLETGSLSSYGTPVRTVNLKKGERLGEDDARTTEEFSVASESVEEVALRFANGTTQKVESMTDYAVQKLYSDKMFNNLAGGMIRPILQQIGDTGLRTWLGENLPELDIHQMALDAIAGGLAGGMDMDLGTVGRVHVDYRGNAINIVPSGVAGIVGATSVSDQQVASIIDDLLDEVETKFIDDPAYLLQQVDAIVTQVSEYGVASLDDGQKSLYNLVFVLLTGHYAGREDAPEWTEAALAGIRSGDLIQNLINTLVGSVTAEGALVDTLVGSLHLNTGLAFSGTWKTIVDGATNNGNLKSILGLVGLDNAGIKGLINSLIGEYMTPSFLTGMGGIAGDICDSMLHDTDGGDNTAIDGSAAVNDDKLNDPAAKFTASFDGRLDPQQPSVENGLYPTQVTMTLGKNPKTERSVRWFTGAQVQNGAVQVSTSTDFSGAQTFKSDSSEVVKPRTKLNLGLVSSYGTQTVRKHSATVTGLAENTAYYYRVGNAELDIWTEPVRFSTGATGDDADTFSFLNVNDSQGMVKSDYATYLNTLSQANAAYPAAAFVLHAGDFVDDGANEDYWTWALDDAANVAQGLAMMPAAGNHEARSDVAGITDANPIVSHFNLSGVNVPEQDQASGVYYSFVYKNATVVVLNTNDLKGNALSQAQYSWADEVLKGAGTTWKIVLLHKSPYSNGPHHDDADVIGIRRQLDQLAADCGIDLVLSGHDHVYNRTVTLSRGNEQEVSSKTEAYNGKNYEVQQSPNGTTFVTAGTAGVKNYEQAVAPEAHSAVTLDLDVPVFTGLQVDGDHLYYDAYKVEGGSVQRVDSFAIAKDGAEQQAWEKVNDLIAALPEQSRVSLGDEGAIVAARTAYNELGESDRARVSGLDRLDAAERALAALKNVAGKATRTVTSYSDLKAAIADASVGTIVVNGRIEGKDTVISPDRDIDINHDVVIKGEGELKFIQFHVNAGAILMLGGNLSMNNVRTAGSLYPSLNPVEVRGGATLIMRDTTSLRTEYGTGSEGYCVKLTGAGATAILGSKGSFQASQAAVLGDVAGTSTVIENGTFNAKNNDRFVVDTRGALAISGGTVSNAWVGPEGSFRMTGGTLEHQKSDNNVKPTLSLQCANAYVTAGAIVPFNGTAVELRDGAQLHILAKKEGDVKIGDAMPYVGAIATSNYRDVSAAYAELAGWGDADGILRAEGAGNTSSVERIAALAQTADKLETGHEDGSMSAVMGQGTNPVFGRYTLHGAGKNGNAMGLKDSGAAYVYGPVRVVENNPVTAVKIDGDRVRVLDLSERESNSVQLTARVEPANAFDNGISWSTSNKDVSTVTQYGKVSLTAAGATTVNAGSASNTDLTDEVVVLGVKPAIEGSDTIEMEGSSSEERTFSATDGLAGLSEQYQGLVKFVWSTSDECMATIDAETGELTELKQTGSVDVIATLMVKTGGRDTEEWADTGITVRKSVVLQGAPQQVATADVNQLLDVEVADAFETAGEPAHAKHVFSELIEGEDALKIGEVERVEQPATGLAKLARFFGLAKPAVVWQAEVTVFAAPYAKAFDAQAGLAAGAHYLAKDQAESVEVVLQWDEEAGAWKLADEGASPITIKVGCARTVTFDAVAGAFASGEKTATQQVAFGAVVAQQEEPTRKGFDFEGWQTAAGESFQIGGTAVADSMTVTARWSQDATGLNAVVTFDAAGGTLPEGASEQLQVKLGDRIAKLPVPTRAGFVFVGWFNGEEAFGREDVVEDSMTLTARWRAEVGGLIELPGSQAEPLIVSYTGDPHAVEPRFNEAFPVELRDMVKVSYRVAAAKQGSEEGGWTMDAPVHAGTYDVRAVFAGTDAYVPVEVVAPASLVIKKGVPIGTATVENNKVEQGTKLSAIAVGGEVTLSGKKVEGAWAWAKPETELAESGAYEAVFTPQNAADIEGVVSEVELEVAKPAPQVDKAALQAKYDEVKDYKVEDYKTMTWHPFAAALDAAGKVLADARATQPQVDEALKALIEAQAGLQEVVRFVFRDVDDSTSHKDDIYWLAANGVSTGWDNGDGTFDFRPYATVRRADMAAFLYRLAGEPAFDAKDVAFTDVDEKTPHRDAILWLAAEGISTGFKGEGDCAEFRPYAEIARCDMAAFLYRMAGEPEFEVKDAFVDVANGTPHREAVLWLSASGVSTGFVEADGTKTFRPYDQIVRCDMAAFLRRMAEKDLVDLK